MFFSVHIGFPLPVISLVTHLSPGACALVPCNLKISGRSVSFNWNYIHKGDSLRLIICAFYSWEMTLNASLDASFDNLKELKGMREKVGEVTSTKAYVTNDEACR